MIDQSHTCAHNFVPNFPLPLDRRFSSKNQKSAGILPRDHMLSTLDFSQEGTILLARKRLFTHWQHMGTMAQHEWIRIAQPHSNKKWNFDKETKVHPQWL